MLAFCSSHEVLRVAGLGLNSHEAWHRPMVKFSQQFKGQVNDLLLPHWGLCWLFVAVTKLLLL